MPHSTFTIGEFAQYAGVNPKTVRYYEEIGLLPQPLRNEVGYRLYSDEDLARLRFVRRAKLLGLSLAEVKQLAGYAAEQRCHSLQEHLLALVETKLAELDRRMVELAALREDLHRLRGELAARAHEVGPAQPAIPAAASCQCLVQYQEKRHVN